MKRGVSVYLRLGRVSNLPTVWSNTLAGALLGGAGGAGGAAGAGIATLAALALAFSAYYVGGMYLNDGFDRAIDARERPERPIPAGLVSARRVFGIGFGLLALGLAGVASVSPAPAPLVSALALAGTIVLYDAWHKANPLSPVIMGLCRVLVYVTAAAAIGRVATPVLAGAACILAYLIGLTYVAKHENKPLLARTWPLLGLAAPVLYVVASSTRPLALVAAAALAAWVVRCIVLLRSNAPRRIPRTVTSLIAGISLVDAALLARAGASVTLVALAAAAWALTLLFQRFVPGT